MSDLDADTLLPSPRMREAARDGEVTQVHRGDRYAEPGDTFAIDDAEFEVVEVRSRTLGDMTEADARREGQPDLEAYREQLRRAHEDFEWDDDTEVFLHRFERR